jgi:hypothetical protein
MRAVLGHAAVTGYKEATLHREDSTTLWTHRGVRGTPLCMAPELWEGVLFEADLF